MSSPKKSGKKKKRLFPVQEGASAMVSPAPVKVFPERSKEFSFNLGVEPQLGDPCNIQNYFLVVFFYLQNSSEDVFWGGNDFEDWQRWYKIADLKGYGTTQVESIGIKRRRISHFTRNKIPLFKKLSDLRSCSVKSPREVEIYKNLRKLRENNPHPEPHDLTGCSLLSVSHELLKITWSHLISLISIWMCSIV